MAKCKQCNGSGSITISVTCNDCHGTGEVITFETNGAETLEACSSCEYGLVYVEKQCHICRGTGVV